MDILKISQDNQNKAFQIIDELKIFEIWKSIGAKANQVGSLKTGLLMKNRDIDFHIYSDNFKLEDSFKAITKLAQNQKIKSIDYKNLLDADDNCIEWHLWYEGEDKNLWQIDMIHIIKDSKYAGYFEKVADRILAVLTPETKLAILTIKNDTPDDIKIPGIRIYKAVIQDGVRSYQEFVEWQKKQPEEYIIEWMP